MQKQQLIHQLQLEPHIEGGYFRRTYQSDDRAELDTPYGARLRLSSIYYMLTNDAPIGRWHLNRSDILHFYHLGAPITYWLIDTTGQLTTQTLGPDPTQGHCLQFVVRGGTWKASELKHGSFGLLSEAVCPGFEYADMTLGQCDKLLTQFPQHRALIQRLQALEDEAQR